MPCGTFIARSCHIGDRVAIRLTVVGIDGKPSSS